MLKLKLVVIRTITIIYGHQSVEKCSFWHIFRLYGCNNSYRLVYENISVYLCIAEMGLIDSR